MAFVQQFDGTISRTTGSSSQFHFLTSPWKLNLLTGKAILCNYIPTSQQVLYDRA